MGLPVGLLANKDEGTSVSRIQYFEYMKKEDSLIGSSFMLGMRIAIFRSARHSGG